MSEKMMAPAWAIARMPHAVGEYAAEDVIRWEGEVLPGGVKTALRPAGQEGSLSVLAEAVKNGSVVVLVELSGVVSDNEGRYYFTLDGLTEFIDLLSVYRDPLTGTLSREGTRA